MKKSFTFLFIFSILFSFLASMPAYAGSVDLLEHEWNGGWGTSYNSSTKTITFEYGWAGFGLNTGSLETSNWLSMTATFTSNAPKGVLKCDYNEGGNSEVSFENESSKTMSFDTGKTLSKVYIQLESSGTLQLSSITVTTSTTTYTVLVTASNGTVSGTGDFAEGEEVTLTATPNENYLFTGWSTSDVNISDHKNDNPLTFNMPASNVSITADFSPCSGQTVTVEVNDGDMGSATGGGSYCAGSQVNLTATPKSGYRFVNWTVTSGSASIDNVNSASAHFTMSNPAAAVTVQANFEVNPCSNTKTVQCVSGYVPVTIYSNANQYVENKHETYVVTTSGDNVSAYYYPLSLSTTISSFTLSIHMANSQHGYAWFNLYKKTANDNGDVEYDGAYYNKVGWQHMVASNDWNSGEFDDAITSFNDGQQGVGSSIPAGDYLIGLSAKNDARFYYFTLTTSENIFCPNTITMQKNGDASAAAPTSSPASAAMAGTKVTITAGEASANHYFINWTATPAVTFENATDLSTTFVMPAEDVTITANYGEVVSSEFTYTTSGSGSITCATASGSSVESGTVISMTAEPSTDYVFTGWTATAGSFSNESALTTNFTMPAEAATVTANFAQIDNVIITGNAVTTNHIAGDGTLEITSVPDFDAFNHNVLKFAYSNMDGKYRGFSISTDAGYTPSALVTGFGFYYKTEKSDDHVAFCFDPRKGQEQQIKWQLEATNNVWKYYYISTPHAINWNDNSGNDPLIIFMNGDDNDAHTTYKNSGVFYMSEIAATSITSKPDINTYHYTYNRGGEMQVNNYGTLCLPMGGTISGATLYSLAGKEESDKTYIVLEDEGNTVVAGKPYITQSTATSYTVTMSGPYSKNVQAGNGLVGTYTDMHPDEYQEDGPHNYILYEKAFKKAGTGVTVGAYRAYLNLDAVGAVTPAPSARRIRMVIEETNSATGLEDLINDQLPVTSKVLIDGQLFIIREGKTYNAQGQMIK